MQTLDSTEDQLQHALALRSNQDAVVTLLVQGQDIDIACNPNQMYEALGIGQLSIACYAIDQMSRGNLSANAPLWLSDEHKRTGTGTLQFCDDGTEVAVYHALGAMLSEGDITATNLLLEELGSQREINSWLKEYLGIPTTGLHDRDDRLFESDAQRPQDMMSVLDYLAESTFVLESLARSHLRSGLRGFNRRDRRPRRQRAAIQLASLLNKRRPLPKALQRNLLDRRRVKPSTVALLKEGVHPNLWGDRYHHEVGWFLGPQPLKVVLCSIGLDSATIRQCGSIIYSLAQEGA